MKIRRKFFFLLSAFLVMFIFGNFKLILTEATTGQITVNGQIGEAVSTSDVASKDDSESEPTEVEEEVLDSSSSEGSNNSGKNSSEKGTGSEGHFPNTGENLKGQKIMIGLGISLVFLSIIIIGESRKRNQNK